MLSVKGIKISYKKQQSVIEEGNLEIQRGQLCFLHAESGAGKSSILSMLAFNQIGNYDSYVIDDKDMTMLSENEKRDFLLNDMAYVSQSTPLLDHMSVHEQLTWASMVGHTSSKEVDSLMKKLHLKRLKDRKIKKLSGGEKQRVAFATAILKNASVYLFDEPTAMQDEKNKQVIVKMINELVQANKIVIVASHELELFEPDIIYSIKDRKLVCLGRRNIEEKVVVDKKHVTNNRKKLGDYLAIRYLLNFPFFNTLFIIVSALCFSLMIVILKLGFTNVEKQYADTYALFQNELFVINPLTDDRAQGDYETNWPIDLDVIEKMKEIDHVTSVEPFKYLLNGMISYADPLTLENNMFFGPDKIHEAEVLKDGKVIQSVNLGEYYRLGESYNGESCYPIAPSYNHQKIDERCEQLVDGSGLYISKELADYLGIEKLDGQSIRLKMGVPIAQGEGSFKNGGDETPFMRRPFYVLEDFEFQIIGILGENIFGNYGIWNRADMYLPIEEIEQIQDETRTKYHYVIEANKDYRFDDADEYIPCIDKPWLASAYVVNVDEYEAVNGVVMDIKEIDPNLDVNATFLSSGKTNEDASKVVQRSVLLYSVILVLTMFIGSIMMNYFALKTKEKDRTYLAINGFGQEEYQRVFYKELMYKLLIASIFIVILTYCFLHYVNGFWTIPLSISLVSLLVHLGIYVCLMYMSASIGKYFYFKKVSR